MNRRRGLTFADILIIVAIILLLVALAIPFFRKSEELSSEEITGITPQTNTVSTAAKTNAPANPRP